MKRTTMISITIIFFMGTIFSQEVVKSKKKEINNMSSYFSDVYSKSKEKKLKKEIARKIYSKEFNEIVNNMDLKQLETLNYLTNRETLKDSLNNSNKLEELKNIENPNISIESAENILTISREIVELENIDSKLKNWIEKNYGKFNYRYFAKNGDKVIRYIRDKETLYKLLPDTLKEITKNISPEKAEQIRAILNGEKIPNKIDHTTKDFENLSLSKETMKEIYVMSKKIFQIGIVVESFVKEINKLYPNIDYTRISRYGEAYLSDKEAEEEIEKKYSEGEYSFSSPYVLINPYKRTPYSGIIKYPDSENQKVKIRVKGSTEQEDIVYTEENKKTIEIFGLRANEENTIILNNGKEETILVLKGEKIKDSLPIFQIKELKEEKTSKGLNYVAYFSEGEVTPIIFDNKGEIRYFLEMNLKNEKTWKLNRKIEGFILFNEDRVFHLNKLGKIESSYLKSTYEKENKLYQGEVEELIQLLDNNRNGLIAIDFIDTGYPRGKIVESELSTGEVVLEVDIYMDKTKRSLNRIVDGKKILFPN
ncbi:MAG: aryl-sulfate sulfotransferase N-terminal domain-containing protein [Fusobacteriaceae bacterium]